MNKKKQFEIDLRAGQHGVDRTGTNLGDYSVSFLPEHRTRWIEHMSMRRLALIGSKYDGPHQNCRASVNISRGKKSGHNPWQMDHQKSMGAKRGRQTRDKYTSVLYQWQTEVIGWMETHVQYFDCISEIDISFNAPYRQRLRCNNTVCMRGVDSNKQAGPLCHRRGYKSSAQALVSFQQAQGKGVPHIPIKEPTKQNDTLDPTVRQNLEWLSFHSPE